MKVQEFKTDKGMGYVLLDDELHVINEVKDFMAFLYPTSHYIFILCWSQQKK